jgi:chromosome segregation ATPase
MTLKESQEKYINSRNEVDNLEKKIEQRERQINRLKIKKSKIQSNNWWGETLVKPIIELVKTEFPETTDWDDGRPVAMGLKCRVSVFGKYKGKTIGITFCPNDLDNGLISFENGMKGLHPVMDLNGFCYKDEVLLTIEQVYDYIQKQLTEIDNA